MSTFGIRYGDDNQTNEGVGKCDEGECEFAGSIAGVTFIDKVILRTIFETGPLVKVKAGKATGASVCGA